MRYIFLSLILLATLSLAYQSASQSSIGKPSLSINKIDILQLDDNNVKDGLKKEYAMSNDLKMHIKLSKSLYDKPSGIFFDSFEISRHFKQSSDGNMDYTSDFNIKPGKHTLIIDSKNVEITAIYTFDTSSKISDIKNAWHSSNNSLVKLTRDGILLKNTDHTKIHEYSSFAFKRFYSDNISLTIELTPIHFVPGMVVFFGDNIYFMFNRDNLFVMQKGPDKTRDARREKISLDGPIQDNKTYTIQINREVDKYTLMVNGSKLVDYVDKKELKNQRFRNIGVTLPNNGCEILIKKIVIK